MLFICRWVARSWSVRCIVGSNLHVCNSIERMKISWISSENEKSPSCIISECKWNASSPGALTAKRIVKFFSFYFYSKPLTADTEIWLSKPFNSSTCRKNTRRVNPSFVGLREKVTRPSKHRASNSTRPTFRRYIPAPFGSTGRSSLGGESIFSVNHLSHTRPFRARAGRPGYRERPHSRPEDRTILKQ